MYTKFTIQDTAEVRVTPWVSRTLPQAAKCNDLRHGVHRKRSHLRAPRARVAQAARVHFEPGALHFSIDIWKLLGKYCFDTLPIPAPHLLSTCLILLRSSCERVTFGATDAQCKAARVHDLCHIYRYSGDTDVMSARYPSRTCLISARYSGTAFVHIAGRVVRDGTPAASCGSTRSSTIIRTHFLFQIWRRRVFGPNIASACVGKINSFALWYRN